MSQVNSQDVQPYSLFPQTHDPVLRHLQLVRCATIAPLPACVVTQNGSQLTAAAPGALPAIDGVTLLKGQPFLVKDQAAFVQNGIYQAVQLGDGSHAWVLDRVTEWPRGTHAAGLLAYALEGTVNAGTAWICPNPVGADIVATSPLVFVPFGAGGVVPLNTVLYNTNPGVDPAQLRGTDAVLTAHNLAAAAVTNVLDLGHTVDPGGGGAGLAGIGTAARLRANDSAGLLQTIAMLAARFVDATTGATRAQFQVVLGALFLQLTENIAGNTIEAFAQLLGYNAARIQDSSAAPGGSAIPLTLANIPVGGMGADGVSSVVEVRLPDNAGAEQVAFALAAALSTATAGATRGALLAAVNGLPALQVLQTGAGTLRLFVGGELTRFGGGLPLFIYSPVGTSLQLGSNGILQWEMWPDGALRASGQQALKVGGGFQTAAAAQPPHDGTPYALTLTNCLIGCLADGALDIVNLQLPDPTILGADFTGIRYTFKRFGAAALGTVTLTQNGGATFFTNAPGAGPLTIVPAAGDVATFILVNEGPGVWVWVQI